MGKIDSPMVLLSRKQSIGEAKAHARLNLATGPCVTEVVVPVM